MVVATWVAEGAVSRLPLTELAVTPCHKRLCCASDRSEALGPAGKRFSGWSYGKVVQLLSDDLKGSAHQRFVVELRQTI